MRHKSWGWDHKELSILWLAGQSADQDRWANDAWKCDGKKKKDMTANQIRMNLGFNFRQCLAAWVLSYFILSSSGEMKQSFSSKPILAWTLQGGERLGRINRSEPSLSTGHRQSGKRRGSGTRSKHRVLWESRLGLDSSESSAGGAEEAGWGGE